MEKARKLFPEQGPLEWTYPVVDGQVPAVTLDELQETAGRLRNRCLEKGQVPKEWKVERLVLIEKERKEEENAKYRSICLLNGMGKVY